MPRPALEIVAGKRISAHNPSRVPSASPTGDRAAVLRIARALGALALLVVGGVHFEQYSAAHFSVIPTIGPLFLVNFIAASTIGLVLLIPVRAAVGPRRLLFDSVTALAGIGVAGGALVALLISEHTPLFGFMEYGYRLEIVIALAAEAVAVISLCVFLACARTRSRRLRGAAAVPADAIRAARMPRADEA
jgi:hypothetical protein